MSDDKIEFSNRTAKKYMATLQDDDLVTKEMADAATDLLVSTSDKFSLDHPQIGSRERFNRVLAANSAAVAIVMRSYKQGGAVDVDDEEEET
jgi:hypothetical protein